MITVKVDRNATLGQKKRIGIIIDNQLKKDEALTVTIKKFSESKTQQQLRLYHGFWVKEAAEFTGDDLASVHWDLKKQHLHPILLSKREGFSELVFALLNDSGTLDETRKLYALYVREMSLGNATKDEVRLFMEAVKHMMIHDWQFTGFTSPEMMGFM